MLPKLIVPNSNSSRNNAGLVNNTLVSSNSLGDETVNIETPNNRFNEDLKRRESQRILNYLTNPDEDIEPR